MGEQVRSLQQTLAADRRASAERELLSQPPENLIAATARADALQEEVRMRVRVVHRRPCTARLLAQQAQSVW